MKLRLQILEKYKFKILVIFLVAVFCDFMHNQSVSPAQNTAEESFAKGTALIKGCNYEMAVNELENCIKLDPKHTGCHCNLIVAYAYNGDLEKATTHLKEVINEESIPGRAILFYNLGSLYKETGNNEYAIDNYNNAIRIMPYFGQPYAALSAAYLMINKKEQAKKYFYKISAMYCFLPDIIPKGIKLGKTSDFEVLGSKGLQPSLYLYHSPAWYLSIAGHYIRSKKIEQAKIEIDKAIQVLDKYSPLESDKRALAEAHVYRGDIYSIEKKPELALEEYKATYNIDPQHIVAVTNLGFIYFKKGHYDLASQYCKIASYVNPNFPAAIQLRELLKREGK